MLTLICDSLKHPHQGTHFLFITQSLTQALEYEPFGEVSIHLLDDASMQELNSQYRYINTTTDVLSFAYTDNFEAKNAELPVGEIFLSNTRVQEQALEQNHSEYEEFLRLIIHGILHILGYDHEEDSDYALMSELELIIITKLQIQYSLLLWENNPSLTEYA